MSWDDVKEFTLFFIIPPIAVIGVLCGLVLGINWVGHHYDQVKCASFGHQSGRVTRFVDYNMWSWGCLTPTPTGWIDVENLRDIGDR